MRYIHIILFSCFVTVLQLNAQEISDTKFGKGLINFTAKDNSFSVKFAPRFQYLSTSNFNFNENSSDNTNTSFLIRRARLKFNGFAFTKKLTYKIELGLSNRDISGASKYTSNSPRIIMDAVIKWNFWKNFVLWAGQTKLPGNVERVISSANLQLVDRSILNSAFNIDRDVGFQLRHHFNLTDKFVIREKVAVSQGEGRNVTVQNIGGLQYTGRLEFLPFGLFSKKGDYSGSDLQREKTPKLALSFTYDINKGAVRNRSNMGSYMEIDTGLYQTDIATLFVDTMFKYNGFSFMGEYAHRKAADPIVKNSDGTVTGLQVNEGTGLNLQIGYLLKNDWELAGRYSTVNVINKDFTTQYTLGISRFFVGHKLKIQSDFSYLTLAGASNNLLYRLQVDIHF